MHDITERESSPMRSLERALHILSVLEESSCAIGVTDLGRASHLSKATVLRMLSVLEKYGFAEKRQGATGSARPSCRLPMPTSSGTN